MVDVVTDASALVDLLLANEMGAAVRRRVTGHAMHAPAHVDAEVLSALGRLSRAGEVDDDGVTAMLSRLTAAPIQRHPVPNLLNGAWARRHNLRWADALYVELASLLDLPLITTDLRLRSVPTAEIVVA